MPYIGGWDAARLKTSPHSLVSVITMASVSEEDMQQFPKYNA